MKNKIITFSMIAVVLLTTACQKKTRDITPQRDPSRLVYMQWFNATVNAARNFTYVNGMQINGTSMTYGSVFPGTAYAFAFNDGYTGIIVKDTLTTATQLPINFTEFLTAGKNYTLFTYDTTTTAKKMLVDNNLEVLTDGTSRIRFANFIYSPLAVPNVDVFSVKKNANIFTNIPVNTVSGFIPAESGSDTWHIRQTGTTTILAQLTATLMANRSYTAVYRGSHRTPTTTPKALSVFANN
jgi:hypothetical protein